MYHTEIQEYLKGIIISVIKEEFNLTLNIIDKQIELEGEADRTVYYNYGIEKDVNLRKFIIATKYGSDQLSELVAHKITTKVSTNLKIKVNIFIYLYDLDKRDIYISIIDKDINKIHNKLLYKKLDYLTYIK